MTISELDYEFMLTLSTLVPLNLLGLVDLVPVADLPQELVLEPVAQKTFPQYHRSPLSGSKPTPIF